MVLPNVLCSLTTFSTIGHKWQAKIDELSELKLKEFALFLTGVKGRERYDLYNELLSLRQEYKFEIPFVHATSEMTDDDYDFLIENFKVKAFNLHPTRDYPLAFPLSDNTRSKIFIENATLNGGDLLKSDLQGFAGICFDLSHCEDERMKNPRSYENFIRLTQTAKVGANHISSGPIKQFGEKNDLLLSQHYFSSLNGFDYLKTYETNFFGEFCAIELEDPIHVQLKIKNYIESILAIDIFGQEEKIAA